MKPKTIEELEKELSRKEQMLADATKFLNESIGFRQRLEKVIKIMSAVGEFTVDQMNIIHELAKKEI